MSKTKKFISIILAIIVLAGVGFGAYLLFGKKDNKISEERAIKLVNETSDKLQKTITTIGTGIASGTASQSISYNISECNNLLAGETSYSDDYVGFLDMLTFANSYLEMINYALGLSKDDAIEFDKTYAGYINNQTNFITVYRDNSSVVFEFGINEEEDTYKYLVNTYGVIDYDNDKNEPSSFSFLFVKETSDTESNATECALEFCLYSVDFKLKMFNCYEVYMYDLNSTYVSTFRNKLSKGTLTYDDIKSYVDFESGYDFAVYTGNIANNISDINIASHNSVNAKTIFNSYSNNVKHLEYCASNKSKLDYKNYTNITKINKDMIDTMSASQNKYNYFVYGNRFYFFAVENYKQFDQLVINLLKTTVADLDVEDFTDGNYNDEDTYVNITIGNNNDAGILSIVKSGINELSSYYESHKNDENYISILLGKCRSGLNLTPTIKAEQGGIASDEEFTYFIRFKSLSDENLSGYVTLYLGDGE